MPWKERDVKNLRLEFVLRALGEKVPFRELCREYGIVPKTGYKWKDRFVEEGLLGLEDRSRRPKTSPRGLSEEVTCRIVRIKKAHESWGARKIREVYARQYRPGELPSESSFKRVLEKAGLVKRRRRRSQPGGQLQNRVSSEQPNEVWTVDFKGWWYTTQGERCEPLTVRDDYAKYLLGVRVPENGRTETVRREFERLFDLYGLPQTIRSDNGPPFAMRQAPLGLSRLSAWWLALGIDLDRIDPGCPYQNGGHERMHRDIARELEGRVEGDLKAQAAALEVWRREFNEERPHEALGMRCPAEVYEKSPRPYKGTPECLTYPTGYCQRRVQKEGSLRIEGVRIRISRALAGWNVGLKSDDTGGFALYFGRLCLGRLELSTESFHPAQRGTDGAPAK